MPLEEYTRTGNGADHRRIVQIIVNGSPRLGIFVDDPLPGSSTLTPLTRPMVSGSPRQFDMQLFTTSVADAQILQTELPVPLEGASGAASGSSCDAIVPADAPTSAEEAKFTVKLRHQATLVTPTFRVVRQRDLE